jgi:two-component system, response regulator YcbB
MRYFIVDDDPAIRGMLIEMIEDEDLGQVVGEAEDGIEISEQLLSLKKIDVLLIDFLMPRRDGMETVRAISSFFNGKIIMISQVETKDLIGEAYSLGIEYYVTKPLNRLEVISVLQKVNERLILEKSIQTIQLSLSSITGDKAHRKGNPYKEKSITSAGNYLLSELGMLGESGSKDLLNILDYLLTSEKLSDTEFIFPPLKRIFYDLAQKKLKPSSSPGEIEKEIKASEQRVRRAIYQGLVHIASLGLTDYSNPKFENYASKFYDFTQVRKKMLEIEADNDPGISKTKINTKKFIQILYWEAKQLTNGTD